MNNLLLMFASCTSVINLSPNKLETTIHIQVTCNTQDGYHCREPIQSTFYHGCTLQNETTSEQYARICADIKGALDVSADTKDEFLQELDPSYLKQQDNFESMDSKSDKSNHHSSSTVDGMRVQGRIGVQGE